MAQGGHQRVVLARFSKKRCATALLVCLVILLIFAADFGVKELDLWSYMDSGLWRWLWPMGAAASFLSVVVFACLLLRVLLLTDRALYAYGNRLVYIHNAVWSVDISQISSAVHESKMITNGRPGVKIYLKDGSFKEMKTFLLLESADLIAEGICDVVRQKS